MLGPKQTRDQQAGNTDKIIRVQQQGGEENSTRPSKRIRSQEEQPTTPGPTAPGPWDVGPNRDQTPTRSRWSRWKRGRNGPENSQGPDQTQPTNGGLKGPLVKEQRGRASRSTAPGREGQDVREPTILDPRTRQASNLEGPDQGQVPKVPSRPPDSHGTK